MKKKYYLFLLLALFSFNRLVNANNVSTGICAGKEINSVSNYCNIGKSYRYIKDSTTYKNRAAKTSTSDGYIGYAYDIDSSTTLSGMSEYGFCLDPGLSSPFDVSLSFGRELDITNSFDLGVYKIYQRYVNDIASGDDKNLILTYVDVALRTLAFKENVAISNDITNSQTNYITYKNVIAPYISNQESTVGEGFDFKYFAEGKFLEDAKDYYLRVINNNLLWKNPLSVNPSVNRDTSTNTYLFNFEVSFSDGTYNFFDRNYDIGYGKAYFEYYLTINGTKLSESSYASQVEYTGDGAITTQPSGNKFNFYVKMSTTLYNQIKTNEGDVKIELQYSAYHPMNSSNVFLNYLNQRTTNSSTDTKYQRMIVFSKVPETNIGSNVITPNQCEQIDNKFYYNDTEVGLSEYIDRCNCSSVDSTKLISEEDVKTFQEHKACVVNTKNEYKSNLPSCDVDSSGSGNLTHETSAVLKRSILAATEGNEYCTLNCLETVNVSDMMNKYSVLAGHYFTLTKYPFLNANKTCTVSVNYSNWKADYITLLKKQIDAYNDWSQKYLNHSSGHSDSKTVCCLRCSPITRHEGTSTKYIYNEYDGTITTSSFVLKCGCGCSLIHTTNDELNEAKSAFIVATENIEKHFETLKYCNNYLYNLGEINKYYNFQQEMRYYYEQEYSKLGLLYNDERPNNVDDSLFNSTATENNKKESGSYESYYNNDVVNYNYLKDIDSIPNSDLNNISVGIDSSNYSINRIAIYEYKYSPSVIKYTDSYTGNISSIKTSLKNPVELGYVYDTDVTAVAKDDNTNYYEFTALGENNLIYNYFKNTDKLKRYCTYEITNDIITSCKGSSCPDDDDLTLNVVYRTVDPTNIDPNKRFNDSNKEGFENWENDLGTAVKNKIESDDTYNPENIEYSFTLDSTTLKKIREYNKTTNYSDFKLECSSDGNECESDFIDNADSGTGIFDKKIATNITGRSTWKVFVKDESTAKCEIDGEKVDC